MVKIKLNAECADMIKVWKRLGKKKKKETKDSASKQENQPLT